MTNTILEAAAAKVNLLPLYLFLLIKSFAGVQGAVFQKSPLVAEGKKSSFRVLIGVQDGQAEGYIIFFSIFCPSCR